MASHCLVLIKEQLENFVQIMKNDHKLFIYALSLSVICAWFLVAKIIQKRQVITPRSITPDLEKPPTRKESTVKTPERPLGVWTPVDFKRPKASPCPDWDVHKTDPLPYRPFRHGPYHITMGLRTMQWDDWIELDNHYLKFHGEKARRLAERGDKCCRTAPEAIDGAIELLEELYVFHLHL